jgi:hypothetical protein
LCLLGVTVLPGVVSGGRGFHAPGCCGWVRAIGVASSRLGPCGPASFRPMPGQLLQRLPGHGDTGRAAAPAGVIAVVSVADIRGAIGLLEHRRAGLLRDRELQRGGPCPAGPDIGDGWSGRWTARLRRAGGHVAGRQRAGWSRSVAVGLIARRSCGADVGGNDLEREVTDSAGAVGQRVALVAV